MGRLENKRVRTAYKEYKADMHLIHKESKHRFAIDGRDHHQRKVYLVLVQPTDILGKRIYLTHGPNYHSSHGGWRTLRELRKHYILITGAAKVLYG